MSLSAKNKSSGDLKRLSSKFEDSKFPDSGRVDFARFESTIYPVIKGYSKLDAATHWSQITSILKGSVEAIVQGSHLTREQYLDEKLFPSQKCRLSQAERRDAYGFFLRYKIKQEEEKLWDDVDKANSFQTQKKQSFASCHSSKVKVKKDLEAPCEYSLLYCLF